MKIFVNICKYLSLDETSLSNGELYTIFTNKNAQGKRATIVASLKETKASNVIHILDKIPLEKWNMVTDVTLEMADSINLITNKYSLKTK